VHEAFGLLQLQLLLDFLQRALIGGCGKRDARHLGKTFVQAGQILIIRAKIVSPLRNAVGFVDGEQRQLAFPQQLQKILAQGPLRRDVEQIDCIGAQRLFNPLLLLGALRRIQIRGFDTV